MTDSHNRDGEDLRTGDEDTSDVTKKMKKMMTRCADMMADGPPPCCGARDEKEGAAQRSRDA